MTLPAKSYQRKTTASGRRLPPIFTGFREEKAYGSDPRPWAVDL
jgi:hypothetical protein